MRWIALVGLALTMAGCGSWKGNGNDEVLPDVVGLATGARRDFGTPSNTLHEHADVNLSKGPLVFFSEPHNPPASPQNEGEAVPAAPSPRALPPGMQRAPAHE